MPNEPISKPKWEVFTRQPGESLTVNITENNTTSTFNVSGSASFTKYKFETPARESSEAELKQGYNELQRRLERRYKGDLSWQTPLSWLPEHRIKTDEYYVDLVLRKLDSRGCEGKESTTEGLDYIYSTGLEADRTLISGEGGFGKTTLCKKIAYDWASNADARLSSFGLLMVFPLRDLDGHHDTETFEEQLLKFCETKENITPKILDRLGPKFLLILDGLDEVSEQRRKEVYNVVKGEPGNAFHQATILVTSRRLSESDLTESFLQILGIRGLSVENQDKFVQNYLKLDEPFRQDKCSSCLRSSPARNIALFLLNLNRELRESIANEKKESDEANALSPFLLFLVCFSYTESSSAIKSRSDLFRNILEVMGERCCKKMNLTLNEEDRERVFLKLGKFFCHQTKYRFTYEEDELRRVFKGDSDFVLGFCLFCQVASTSYLKTKFAYQLNHKLLYDFLKLNFIGFAATRRLVELSRSLRNGFEGLGIDLNFDRTVGMKNGCSVLGIEFRMDIGSVVVENFSNRPSARVYMKPEEKIRGDNYFRFPKIPFNASYLGHLFSFRSDAHLNSLLSKAKEFNENVTFEVHWPKIESDYSKQLYVEYTEDGVEHESRDSFFLDSIFPFPFLFRQLSSLRVSSNRNLRYLSMEPLNPELLRSLLDEFFAFEETMSARDSNLTHLDIFRVLMTQTIEKEDEKWKRSNEFILVRDGNFKRKVLTVENILKDESWLEQFLPNISEVKGIRFAKRFDRPLDIPPKFAALPLGSRLLHADV